MRQVVEGLVVESNTFLEVAVVPAHKGGCGDKGQVIKLLTAFIMVSNTGKGSVSKS